MVLGLVLVVAAAIPIYFALATDEPTDVRPLDGLPQRFAAEVPELQRVYAVPGVAAAVISEGRVWNKWSFGWADRERRIPVDDDTVFNVASISKAVTAWGVWHLAKTGRIDVDAPVSRYLKRWSLPPSKFDHDAVTVRALLTHTAGIAGRAGSERRGRIDGRVALDAPLPSIPEWLADNPDAPVNVVKKPGSEAYSNGGYLILQLMIEDVTGQPFAKYMRDEVLAPLGMTSSSFVLDEQTRGRLAQWYEPDGNVVGPQTQLIEAAAAGLYTTLDDLVRFTIANLSYDTDRTSGMISLDTLKAMRVRAGWFRNFNLGYESVARLPRFALHAVRFVGHSGGGKGYSGVIAMVPTTGDALVVVQNSPNAIYPQLLCTWANARFGVDCADRSPPVAMPQALLEQLSGTYAVPNEPDIVLRSENGVLMMFQDQRIYSLVLSADQNKFGALFAPLTFTVERAADGSVSGLALRKLFILSSHAARVSGSVRLDDSDSCHAGLLPPAICSRTD